MALGWMIFGTPWAGVILATAAFCALCYWMLRGWTTPGWALAGGALAVMEFGPLSQWMNGYWGGAWPPPRAAWYLARCRDCEWRAAGAMRLLLGLGLAIHLLTRPVRNPVPGAGGGAVLRPGPGTSRRGAQARCDSPPWPRMAVTPAIVLTLLQNRQVTGSWTTLPYALSQYQYGVPTSLTIQANPVPHAD
jgi:hypothetical protein